MLETLRNKFSYENLGLANTPKDDDTRLEACRLEGGVANLKKRTKIAQAVASVGLAILIGMTLALAGTLLLPASPYIILSSAVTALVVSILVVRKIEKETHCWETRVAEGLIERKKEKDKAEAAKAATDAKAMVRV